jgi:hypothetical protein
VFFEAVVRVEVFDEVEDLVPEVAGDVDVGVGTAEATTVAAATAMSGGAVEWKG